MEPKDRINQPFHKMMINNFFGGIAWSLGVTVGLSIILTILGYMVSKVNWIPIVGQFTSQITNSSTDSITKNPPKLKLQ